jgi:hypothetical protein
MRRSCARHITLAVGSIALFVVSIFCRPRWSAHLPAGTGLIGFSTPEEALDGLDRIDGDYARHARRAVEIARDHFDASQVLPRLLETAGA